jgi:hypothetical protein
LAWLALNDPFLRAAFWIGVAAVVLIFLLMLQIFVLRIRLRKRDQRAAATLARWRPVLNAVMAGAATDRPDALEKGEHFDFFKLWLHFQASVRGDARAALNLLADELGCHEIALRMLTRGGRGERLLAILVMGHLRDPVASAPLQMIIKSSNDRLLSMHASAALVQIDPTLAAQQMAPALVFDGTWPVREVVTVLKEARTQCEPVFKALLPAAPALQLPRLLQVMEGLRIALPADSLAPLLRHDAPEVLICVLRVASAPGLREAVLELAGHEDWRVRMHAAKALGRLGVRGDVPVLIKMLADREWWVRYRTAQVLVGLPFLTRTEVKQIAVDSSDRFAGDMLRQVLAETAVGA